jgi:hypothetical protein
MLKKELNNLNNLSAHLFFTDLANLKDEHLHILRGHLLIEEQLCELVNLKTKKPDTLTEARLTFNQILCLAEALYWQKDSGWLWEGIRKLNNIRNSFSHKLNPKNYNDLINSFLSLVEGNNPDEFYKGLSAQARVDIAMSFIYSNLYCYLKTST